MKIRGSHLVSLAILAGLAGWMYTGKIIVGGQADPAQPTIAEREAKRSDAVFRVRTQILQPSQRQASLQLRGRTKANSMVSVRAETGGTVEARAVDVGDVVKLGDLLCTIDRGVRQMQLTQAETLVAQAQADYDSTKKLVGRGYATRSKLRALIYSLDAAKAAEATAKQEIGRTEIRANVGGVVQEPLAEVGDNLAPGGVCLTLMDFDPMMFTGQVSEREINQIKKNMSGLVTLISGEKVTGKISTIGAAADAKTRTFEVEMELPNENGTLREGLTAQAQIPLAPTQAYEVAANWLTLADNGAVGVRAVGEGNKVEFHPVTILSQGADTMWVNGLRPGLQVIVLGQNFVAAGEVVEPIAADKATEQLSKVAK